MTMARMAHGRMWVRRLGAGGLAAVTGWSLVDCTGGSDRPVDTYVAGTEAGTPFRDSGSHDATMPAEKETGVPEGATASDASADSDGASCEAGLSLCGATCTDTQRDPGNCGACTLKCNNGLSCIGGQCACSVDAGQTYCQQSGGCAVLATDMNNCGACEHSCQGAMCAGGLCQPTVVAQPGGTSVWDLAVDTVNMYWSQYGTTSPAMNWKPIGGGSITPLDTNDGYLSDPRGIAVDGLWVYWVDYANGVVEKVPKAGGPRIVLVAPPDGGPPPADGGAVPDAGTMAPGHPSDIAVDDANIYWVSFDGQVLTMPKDSDGGAAWSVIANGENHPVAIAVDDVNVYWVNQGDSNPNTGSVRQSAKGAGTGRTILTLSGGEDQPSDIAVDATSVYWTNRVNPGTVKKAPIGGGAVVTLADKQGAPTGIAVDSADAGPSGYIYWTNFGSGFVMRLPKVLPEGGAPFVLASGQNNPFSITVDLLNVYWVNQGNGSILQVAK